MLIPLLLVLVQDPQSVAQLPAPRVEVTPANAEVAVGQTLQLQVRAFAADGRPLQPARVRWFAAGNGGTIDSTGVLSGGFLGTTQVTAVVVVPGSRNGLGRATIHIVPAPASTVQFVDGPARVVAGTRLTLVATAHSAQGDRATDPVTFASSNSKVASVAADGRLSALAAGRAVITARAGQASSTLAIDVLANTVASIKLSPATTTARTGDVVRFTATGVQSNGKTLSDVATRWSVAGGQGVGMIGANGSFVAETPGSYTVTAEIGGRTTDALVTVTARKVGRGFEVLGRVPVSQRAAEVWVHPDGKCAYLTTISDRVYAIDVSDPRAPAIVDSMMTDARLVNDVMTTEDGKYGVFSREGSSNRKDGIVIFDASDACHPKPISQYTETVSGGVHSSYVYQGHVFLTDDATGSMRVIDITDPMQPHEVARWQTEQVTQGRYLHDIAVTDGIAYLSYWDDGLVVLDVGNGVKGGSPENPKFISQFKYDLDALYARVDEYWGLSARGTHTAWRQGKYVFIGDEVYASKASPGLKDGNDLTFGRLQVLDVSNLEQPKLVAWYEPTDGGVHNIWAVGDTLYMGNYQGGARAVDISGELQGDLLRQGREMAWTYTADDKGAKPRATFAWGAVVKNGIIYVPDINTGLWIMKLEPKDKPTP